MAKRECLLLVGVGAKSDNGLVVEKCIDEKYVNEIPKTGCEECVIFDPTKRTAIKPVPINVHP